MINLYILLVINKTFYYKTVNEEGVYYTCNNSHGYASDSIHHLCIIIKVSRYYVEFQILDAVNLTRLAYEKNIWIRGPHHSKVSVKWNKYISYLYMLSK